MLLWEQILLVLMLYDSNAFADDAKKDCSLIKADSGVELYEKIRCKMGKEKGEGLGKKLKKLFKKKNSS